MTDLGSEYGRLLAERDRLISEGVDPADLLVPEPPPCDHTDAYGSTVIFVQGKPRDGVCLLCDAYFPAIRRINFRESQP